MTFATLLPPNASAPEFAIEASAAQALALPIETGTLWNPATCPVDLLPFLAWALSVDRWDGGWSEQVKRQVIAASPAVHRQKGTRAAVQAALAALMVAADIREWWQVEPNLTPGTFVVRVYAHSAIGATAPALTADLIASIKAFVGASAPISRRWHFEIGILTSTAWTLQAAVAPALKIIDLAIGIAANPAPHMTLRPFGALGSPLKILNLELAITT